MLHNAGGMRAMPNSCNRGSVVLSILLLASSIPALSSQAENDFPATLSIDVEDGTVIDDEFIFNALFIDELEPHTASWELLDSTSTRHYVSVSEFQQGVTSGPVTEWTFDIAISPDTVGSCSCILVVSVIDSKGTHLVESASIFIRIPGVTDESFPPTLHILRTGLEYWYSESYIIDALSSTLDGTLPAFTAIIRPSSTIKCTYGGFEEEDSLYAVNYNSTPHPSVSKTTWDGDTLSFEIDLVDFDNGWHDIIIFAQSEFGDSTYSHDCISIKIDNAPPSVILNIPEVLPEGTDTVNLDASSTFDEYWGIQGLTYTWSIKKTEGSGEEINQVFSGLNYRSIELDLVSSGVYDITLSVSDNAGNIGLSTTTLEILNMAPTARLTINGEDYFDNDQVTLYPDSSIYVDASSSFDTSNDIDGLRYVWRVDNVPTYEGSSRTIAWPDGVDDDSFVLSIEVIDDDSASSMISVVVVNDSESGSPPLSILILIISGIFLSYSLFRRSSLDDSDIPKWN